MHSTPTQHPKKAAPHPTDSAGRAQSEVRSGCVEVSVTEAYPQTFDIGQNPVSRPQRSAQTEAQMEHAVFSDQRKEQQFNR